MAISSSGQYQSAVISGGGIWYSTTGFIQPLISATSNIINPLVYDLTSQQISYSTGKTFVIDHPQNKNKYLIHACLEGPEAGVYYRGKSEIANNEYIKISLPKYTSSLASDFTIQITPIHNKLNPIPILTVSEVENNRFYVYGTNTKFFWTVYGKRSDIDVEPLKKDVNVKGDGPYLWI